MSTSTMAQVEFESANREVKLVVTCSNGIPQGKVVEEQESGH